MQEIQINILTDDDCVTVVELSQLLCVPEPIIVEWIEHEVVYARRSENTYYIACSEITKAKAAVRLTRDLGVNPSGIAIIMQLRQKIKKLEAMINQE
jgi:hypothetical protein